MLASVKDGLYHPMLPSFRRMDMDTAAHKLPEDHARTTTPLNRSKNDHPLNSIIGKKLLNIAFSYFQTISSMQLLLFSSLQKHHYLEL